MANLATSDLSAITSIEYGDLINISEDQGGGSYESRKITAGNFDMVKGRRYYGVSNGNPAATPAFSDGGRYYDTGLDMEMVYDATRAKWLSVESVMMYFGRNGNVNAGVYYRTINGKAYSATNGFYAAWDGTIVGLGWTKDDTNSTSFEVTQDGTTISTVADGANTSGSDISLNDDFTQGDILGVRNISTGAQTTGVHGWVRIKWRA